MSYYKDYPAEIFFRMTVNGDPGGAAGTGFTSFDNLELSKNGATFASPSGTVYEVGRGWYKIAADAANFSATGKCMLFASKGSYRANVQFDVEAFADPTPHYFSFALGQDKQVFFRLTHPDGSPCDLTLSSGTEITVEYMDTDGGGFLDISTLPSGPVLIYSSDMGGSYPDRGWYQLRTNTPLQSIFGNGGVAQNIIINAWSNVAGKPAKGTTILRLS